MDYPEEEITPEEWARFVAENWKDMLGDPREDIYTLQDGEPLDANRNG